MPWKFDVLMPDGSSYKVTKLLADGDTNTKLAKSNNSGKGYLTVGLSLSPANESGYEMCRGRSKGCTQACLNTSGHGKNPNVQRARIAKTILLMEQRKTFVDRLFCELALANKRAKKEDKQLACRMNVFSDVPWEQEHPEIFEEFKDVQFYDYTKILDRALTFGTEFFPKNYHLTFSRSENNEKKVKALLAKPINIAVVFNNKHLPETWYNRPVINGDATDLRFLDAPYTVIGLYVKGDGKKDKSGFVLSLPMVK